MKYVLTLLEIHYKQEAKFGISYKIQQKYPTGASKYCLNRQNTFKTV